MINAEKYIERLTELLKSEFDTRLVYVGLQGSYLRGEATTDSDIDIMVVIDNLTVSDLKRYRNIIESMGDSDKSCGFICSKEDLANWNPLEICNLIHGTKDHYGKLCELVPVYSELDIRNFVKLSVNNLYHEICHRYIHAETDRSSEKLSYSYKAVFFILQNLYFLTYGEFVLTKAELLLLLAGKNFAVLKRAIDLSNGGYCEYSESFELLFSWCQETLKAI